MTRRTYFPAGHPLFSHRSEATARSQFDLGTNDDLRQATLSWPGAQARGDAHATEIEFLAAAVRCRGPGVGARPAPRGSLERRSAQRSLQSPRHRRGSEARQGAGGAPISQRPGLIVGPAGGSRNAWHLPSTLSEPGPPLTPSRVLTDMLARLRNRGGAGPQGRAEPNTRWFRSRETASGSSSVAGRRRRRTAGSGASQ